MSRRSYDGAAHEKRLSRHRITDDDVFDYVLRVALLSHLTQPKPIDASPKAPHVSDPIHREHSSRLSALSNFSIGDMFRDGNRSVKFPEKLLKVLDQRLQKIGMGQDPAFSDQLTRRTMTKFYNQFAVDSFKRQMKENRKIEELILLFASQATASLKKEPTLLGDLWKPELNNQIAQFIKLLRECLRGVHGVSPELTSRLDGYTAKLAPTLSASGVNGYAHSDSGYDSSSTSRDRDSIVMVPPANNNVADMKLVQVVKNLFKLREDAVQQEVDTLRGNVVTDKAGILDLKACLKNIAAGVAFPGRREDFADDEAWQHWRTQETTQLQQIILAMVQNNPELAKSAGTENLGSFRTSNYGQGRPMSNYSASDSASTRNQSISSRRSMLGMPQEEDGDDDGESHNFVLIPPNPRKYYKRLVELCLVADLELMLSPEVDDNDEVSLGILSPGHIELINECATRWRVGHPYRAACFLDLVKSFYERGEVPMECVPEALAAVLRVMGETEVRWWMIEDSDYLAGVYAGLFNIFLSSLYHAMDAMPALVMDDIAPYLEILESIRACPLLGRFDIDVEARMGDVMEKVRHISAGWYGTVVAEKQKSVVGVNRALPLLLTTDEIEKVTKSLDKKFPEPLLGKLDLVSLFVEVVIPRFMTDVQASQKRLFESSMNGPTPDVPIQDIFALYRRCKLLMAMYKAFCPEGKFTFNTPSFYEPYVRQWLINTDDKTKHWVEAAISHDKFLAEGVEGHSSSIVDLFDSLRSPIGFLQDLEWDDEFQEARFFTSLAKTISKTVEQYCRSVEILFMNEMFPRPTDYLQPQKSSAWLEKARQLAITGERKVEPFNFLPQTCVKLNNVEAARKLLDKMYNQMQVEKVAAVLRNAPPVPDKVEKEKWLFSVKVVRAESLVPLDSSPSSKLDTFVTLSDEEGNRKAKTRTIYETLDPRWDETFDLSVEKPLWLMVSVRDRALVGKHDIVGRAYLCLDPRRFNDMLMHDLWMDLDTQGKILVRVSMEGEKDEVEFYFGRAFRSLKRAESDMVRVFIDKMVPFIEQCLSRNVVRTLMKSREQGLDYNKALGGVTAFYRSAMGGSSAEPQIPLPSSEKPRVRPEDLTDVEIEQAIAPLFDYLDANMQTLNTHLSDTAKEMVMTRVWKEILGILEGLLIPPLSELPSDMKPSSDKEVDVVFRWLKFLRDYFYANGEGPVPLEALQNQKYRDVVSIRLYYDWHTDALMEECVRMMQQSLRSAPSMKKRVKSVYMHRNLGTIKERKKEKAQESEPTSELVIMRILRMRPGTSEFISQQLQIRAAMQAEKDQQARAAEERRGKRQQQQQQPELPPVPPLPK